jgi:hypothetical protein
MMTASCNYVVNSVPGKTSSLHPHIFLCHDSIYEISTYKGVFKKEHPSVYYTPIYCFNTDVKETDICLDCSDVCVEK